MAVRASNPRSFRSYTSHFPKEMQVILRKVRATIVKTVPKAGETISYGMPAFTLNGTYLVYLAGYKRHFSLYPVPSGDAVLRRQMATYKAGPGTLRFKVDRPVPYALITKVIKALRRQNMARAAARGRRK